MRRFLLASSLVFVSQASFSAWDGRVWKDGRAEVAVYESKVNADGKAREFKETLTTTREEHGKTKVFKFNTAQTFDGANHPYSYLVSVFADAAIPENVLRIVATSQEWGGNVVKTFVGGQLTISSYRPGETETIVPLEMQPGDLFEDALPLTLRAMPFREGLQMKGRLWESFASNVATVPAVVPVTVTVMGEDTVRSRAGALPCWKVTVERDGGKTDSYWFEKKDPRILVRMERADGAQRTLFGRTRWMFWDKRLPRPNVLN